MKKSEYKIIELPALVKFGKDIYALWVKPKLYEGHYWAGHYEIVLFKDGEVKGEMDTLKLEASKEIARKKKVEQIKDKGEK